MPLVKNSSNFSAARLVFLRLLNAEYVDKQFVPPHSEAFCTQREDELVRKRVGSRTLEKATMSRMAIKSLGREAPNVCI